MSGKRVLKVGGSLLDLPDLGERIRRWLRSAAPGQNIFLAGGGEFCNQLRALHRQFALSETLSHELSLDLMSVTARILSCVLKLEVTDSLESIAATNRDVVFDCRAWLSQLTELPQTWDVTSDSISALLARSLNCELVLFKSVDVQETDDALDACFDRMSRGVVRIEFVNLRTPG